MCAYLQRAAARAHVVGDAGCDAAADAELRINQNHVLLALVSV